MCALAVNTLWAQDEKKEYVIACIGFYNLENLFDTIVDPDTNLILREDFTPHGPKVWNSKRYAEKMDRLSEVISKMGTEVTPDGPAVLGVTEVENRSVLEDLVNTPKLKPRGYKVIHYDSPDKRGIDVGFLYQPKYFKPVSSRNIPLNFTDDPKHKTRDQLLVSGYLNGEMVHFVVTHWPSRRGGEKRSRPGRIAAAELGRKIIDSLRAKDPNAKVLYMGDLNDDPTDASVKKYMMAVGKQDEMGPKKLFNPMEDLYKKGVGTLAWRDTWNLFDQIILSSPLISKDYSSFRYYKVQIFNKKFLLNPKGNFKGYPFRTYVGTNYQGGYSDHFPVYVFLIKEKK